MKAKAIDKLTGEGGTIAVFAISDDTLIKRDAFYEISRAVEPKTSAENRRLWAIINNIARATNKTSEQVYCRLLLVCNIRSEVRYILDEELEAIQAKFRCVKVLMKPDPRHLFVRIYFGVSKMNKEEVLFLIEAANMWCDRLGIRR